MNLLVIHLFDKIREVFLAPLLGCFRRLSWCAILYEGHTGFVHEKLSFYRLFCCRSAAEKRLHLFLKDFFDINNTLPLQFVPAG